MPLDVWFVDLAAVLLVGFIGWYFRLLNRK